MSYVVSSQEEMRLTEENSEILGVSRLILMENAGCSVAKFSQGLLNKFPAKITVVCGPGNNGGDGLVSARYLLEKGYEVEVFLLSKKEELKSREVRVNYEKFAEKGKITSLEDEKFLEKLRTSLSSSDLIIDAIFGTGIKGDISGVIAESIKLMNDSGKFIVAVDTPSGLDPFSGKRSNVYVRANATLTFHSIKPGLIENKEITGSLQVVDIGIPKEANVLVNEEEVLKYIPARKKFSHKGNYGSVLVIGGSKFYSGAPMLVGISALRAGAGLVFVACPEAAAYSIKSLSPDLITLPLPGEYINERCLEYISDFYNRANVLVIGNGIGREKETIDAVGKIVMKAQEDGKKVLVDADGLMAFDIFKGKVKGGNVLLTPHAGEFLRMSGVKVGEEWSSKYKEVKKVALESNCTILLKGYHTVISDGKIVKVVVGGNPGLSKGGSGDVLAGIISGFLAQGLDLIKASVVGSFVLNSAADSLFKSLGFHFLASDLTLEIAKVLSKYDRISE